MQEEFDFEEFQSKITQRRQAEVEEARAGLEVLEDKRTELVNEHAQIKAQIEILDKKILNLQTFLNVKKEAPDKTTNTRDRGVSIVMDGFLTKYDALDLRRFQDFDTIVAAVRRIKPSANVSTVRSALHRMVSRKELLVRGKRGGREWQINFDDPDLEEQHENGQEVLPQVEITPTTRGHDEIVATVKDMVVKAAMKNSNGVDAKTIAWIMTESGADEVHFEQAVTDLEKSGAIEVTKSLKDDGQVIMLPVDPDSKEGLKRQRVEGNPLFPEMEKPSHA